MPHGLERPKGLFCLQACRKDGSRYLAARSRLLETNPALALVRRALYHDCSMNSCARWLAAFLLMLCPNLAWAQATPEIGVVTTLQGQANVARASQSAAPPLNIKDAGFDRDRIQPADA